MFSYLSEAAELNREEGVFPGALKTLTGFISPFQVSGHEKYKQNIINKFNKHAKEHRMFEETKTNKNDISL